MTENNILSTDWRLRRLLLFILTASFILTPLANSDIWWQLSRGRTVMSDMTPPGPVLTAGTPRAEADWLGGLPFYLTYQLAGFTGLMMLKVAAVGLLLYLLLKRFEEQLNWIAFFIVVLVLFAANTAWQPTPQLMDCWFLFLTWILTERWSREPSRGKQIPILILLVLWANCAPLCLFGIAVVAFVPALPGIQQEIILNRKKRITLLLTALIAIMISPRGWFTPYDSLIQIMPGIFYDSQLLALTVWHPTLQNGASIETIGFGLLTFGTLLSLIFYSSTWIEVVTFLLFAIPGWANYDCLPTCVIGMLLVLGHILVTQKVQGRILNQFLPAALSKTLLILSILFLSWKSAAGVLPGQSQRLGWGITPELDITLLTQTIGPINYEGTGHCMGNASAGMLCWIKSDRNIQPVRTLRQALLQGLLFEEVSLNQELSSGWVFQKPRSNGSWGGWWIRLKNRNCQLLLVPNGDAKTIRLLFDSRWQPMSLDAAEIPFGWSGERLSSPKIVELLPAKDFLNRGEWTFSLPSPSGTPQCSDWWGSLTGDPNIRPALLQARTFRAMKLYTAALRILRPLLQHDRSPEVVREFQLCQKELAYQEKLDTGNPSYLRLLSYYQTAGESDPTLDNAGPIIKQLTDPQKRPDLFTSAIENYVLGNWEEAIKQLSTSDSESLYAKAQIMLESGNPENAAKVLQQLILLHPSDRLVVPSQSILESIQ